MQNKMKLILIVFTICALNIFPQSGGKISGIVYMDYFYNISRDTGLAAIPNTVIGGPRDGNGFDIRRAYFTYDYIISESFTSRFRLEADGRALTDNKRFGVFVKDAFIKWKEFIPGQEVILGIQPPPAYEISESYYGFRSLEKTIMDLRGVVSSRDFGLAVKGKIIKDLNYWILFGNNSSNSPESDKYKRLYAHLSIKPVTNVTATLYGDVRFRGKTMNRLTSEMVNNNVFTSALFIGYSDSKTFSIGAESFYQITENSYIPVRADPVIENLNGLGISTFAWLKLFQNLTATLRYDFFDPGINEGLNYDSRNFIIAGLSYNPIDRVSIIPNILIETFEKPLISSIDPSITSRITVTYEFQ